MEGHREGGVEPFRQAAERARAELRRRLASEADRLERELAQASERIIERTARAAVEHATADAQQRLAEVVRAEERAAAARLRAEVESLVLEARAELVELRDALGPRTDPRARTADDTERLEMLLARMRAAERRLHESDARTRRALSRLRSAPE